MFENFVPERIFLCRFRRLQFDSDSGAIRQGLCHRIIRRFLLNVFGVYEEFFPAGSFFRRLCLAELGKNILRPLQQSLRPGVARFYRQGHFGVSGGIVPVGVFDGILGRGKFGSDACAVPCAGNDLKRYEQHRQCNQTDAHPPLGLFLFHFSLKLFQISGLSHRRSRRSRDLCFQLQCG